MNISAANLNLKVNNVEVLKDLSFTKGLNKVWVEFGTVNAANIDEMAAETMSTVFSIICDLKY